jgi:hypothetical protein
MGYLSKGLENDHRPLALQAATPERAVRQLKGWSPVRCRGIEHSGP